MHNDLKLKPFAEIVDLTLQYGLKVLMGEDVEWGSASEHSEG